MENKNVGWLIIGISVVVIGIIFLFNTAMKRIIDEGCPIAHDALYCPAYGTINQQTYLSLFIVGIVFLIGLFLLFSKPQERVIVKTKVIEKHLQKKSRDLAGLTAEEKQVLEMVASAKTIFQAELIERTGFGKAKMTRVLDRLEGKGIVERKRRGMTNVVVLAE